MAPSLTDLQSSAFSILRPRDAASSFADARDTLSSWDKCMNKAYCKWPVIIVIVIGALIILSILFCCIRCLCCGVECCCGCFSCCNACCPKPRGGSKKHKNQQYQPAPQQPPYNYPGSTSGPQPWHPSQQYYPSQPQHQDAMMYGANKALPEPHSPSPAPPAATSSIPQYARFSQPASKKKNGEKGAADTLPAMPSWAAAQERQVEDTSYHPPSALDKESGAYGGGEEGIPLQDRKQPGNTIQPSTFGTPEYEQGYKSPSPPLAQNEYSTGQHDGAAYGFVAAGLPSHRQNQYQNQQQQRQLSPPPSNAQSPYNNNNGANPLTGAAYQPQNQSYPSRTVSPISSISSPSQTQPFSPSTGYNNNPNNSNLPPISTGAAAAGMMHSSNTNRAQTHSPTSPSGASSIYSARPPPSYHTYNPHHNQSHQNQNQSSPTSVYGPPSRNPSAARSRADNLPELSSPAPPMPTLNESQYGGGGGGAMYNMAAGEQQRQQQRQYSGVAGGGGIGGVRQQQQQGQQQYQAYKPYQGGEAAELDGSRDTWR